MEGDFSIAWEALRALRDRGVSPADVWEVLGSDRRLSRQVGAARAVVYGRAREGRWLAILVQEDSRCDGSWVVLAARELTAEEALQVRWLLGGAV